MHKYAVRVEGEGFLLKEVDKEEEAAVGFFATRYVEALDEPHATEAAVQLVCDELETYAGAVRSNGGEGSRVWALEVTPLDSFGEGPVPGLGMTWFPEDE